VFFVETQTQTQAQSHSKRDEIFCPVLGFFERPKHTVSRPPHSFSVLSKEAAEGFYSGEDNSPKPDDALKIAF
jgi:hypothetical protein